LLPYSKTEAQAGMKTVKVCTNESGLPAHLNGAAPRFSFHAPCEVKENPPSRSEQFLGGEEG